MKKLTTDIAILGSGFAGCLTALILDRLGYRVVVVEKSVHPRFAIGESSTPTADLVLHDLAERFALPRLTPLCRYGQWRRAYPNIACGVKRGFGYFFHPADEPFVADPRHRNELLVAASASDDAADTHWFRADVDAFFADEVQAAGIAFLDRTTLDVLRNDGPAWTLSGIRETERIDITANFVIDATGPAAVLPRALEIPATTAGLHTHSYAIYSHFRHVEPWQTHLDRSGARSADHPFPCDRSALHHVFDDGWMWQLRFVNGVTSAGFVLDAHDASPPHDIAAADEWDALLERFPSIAAQFAAAEIADPPYRILRTERLQRRFQQLVGTNWALLPHTAGFIDPLHSTGIAQTLCGIERLATAFENANGAVPTTTDLQSYERQLNSEFDLIDELVHGCYVSRKRFRLFAACTMLYFAAATTYEQRRTVTGSAVAGRAVTGSAAFLLADDPSYRDIVHRFHAWAVELGETESLAESAITDFESQLAAAIAPYNTVGLCDPSARNMYRHTSVEKPR